jgi:hypothetical protein
MLIFFVAAIQLQNPEPQSHQYTNKIDVEILLLCEFSKASFLMKLERKEIEVTIIEQRLAATHLGRFIISGYQLKCFVL